MSSSYKRSGAESQERSARTSSHPNRREMLITIGELSTGLVFGNQLESAARTLAPPLPPGVYLPSREHLGHALATSAPFHPIPVGSPTDYIEPRTGPFTPTFFSGTDFPIIRRLVQILLGDDIPAADGSAMGPADEVAEWIDLCLASAASVRTAALRLQASHKALAVVYFGADRVRQLETSQPEAVCTEGLHWLSHRAQAEGAPDFLSLREDRQIAVLNSMDGQSSSEDVENRAGTRFFALLKREVIRAFYTSQTGLRELDFKGNSFYSRSPGCARRM